MSIRMDEIAAKVIELNPGDEHDEEVKGWATLVVGALGSLGYRVVPEPSADDHLEEMRAWAEGRKSWTNVLQTPETASHAVVAICDAMEVVKHAAAAIAEAITTEHLERNHGNH